MLFEGLTVELRQRTGGDSRASPPAGEVCADNVLSRVQGNMQLSHLEKCRFCTRKLTSPVAANESVITMI